MFQNAVCAVPWPVNNCLSICYFLMELKNTGFLGHLGQMIKVYPHVDCTCLWALAKQPQSVGGGIYS